MATLRINQLPLNSTPTGAANIAIDGSATERTTLQAVIDELALQPSDIGSSVQAYSANLDTWSGLSASSYYTSAQVDANFQPLDATLTALAGLTTAANQLIYATGANAFAMTGLTSFARSLLDDADASTARATLEVVIGTDVQAYDAGLADISGLTPTDGNIIVGDGGNWVAESGGTARTSLGLAIGSDVQAYNAQLADIAGLTPAQGNILYYDGSNWVVLAPGTDGQLLKTSGVGANPEWISASGTGDMIAANNLSDVASAATSFDNIKQAATDSYTGVVELATGAEVNAKTSGKAVTADVAFNPLVPVAITSSATPGVDLSSSRKFTLTFDESFTLQLPTSCVVGDEFVIHFTEGSGSGVTAAFASGYVGPDGALPDINTGAGERTRIHFEVTAQTGGTATEVLAVAAGGLWGAP